MLARRLLGTWRVPLAVADDTGTTDAATATSGNVLTNDTGTLTVSAVNGLSANVGEEVTGSNGGVFVIGSDGAWTFDPGDDFDSLTGSNTTATSVTYYASNGQAEADATLTVTVSSSAVELWTPTAARVPYLQMWKDASDPNNFTIPDPITTVVRATDKSGQGRHAFESVSVKKGTKCIQSVGEYTPLMAAIDGIADGAINEYTVFILAKPTKASAAGASQSNSGVTFYNSDGGNNSIPLSISGNTSTSSGPVVPIFSVTSNYIAMTETRNGLAPYLLCMPHSVGQAPLLAMFERNTSNAIRGGVNGAYQAGATGVVSSLSWLGAMLMSQYAGVTSAFQGDIYEVILVHNGALGAFVIQSMEGYFAHKWDAIFGNSALKDKLPSDHPYKTTAPSFTPADMTTSFWVDFSDDTSLLLGQGGHITSWADISTRGRHSTQSTLSVCPMRIKDGVGFLTGRNFVQDWSFLNGMHYHVAAVFSFQKAQIGGVFTGSMTNTDLSMLYSSVYANGGFSSHNSAGTDINLDSGVTPALPMPTPAMWAWNYKWGDGRRVFRGGNQKGYVGTSKSVGSFNNGRIGALYKGSGADIKMHEIVAISSQNYDNISPFIQMVDGYLAHKWDAIFGTTTLVGDLSASHLYKSAPPVL